MSAPATTATCSGETTATTLEAIEAAARGVLDPELGDVTIGELGLIRSISVAVNGIEIVLTPTFLGCPATRLMANDVQRAVERVAPPGRSVTVRWENGAAWSSASVSPSGRKKLGLLNIAVGDQGACPNCGGRLEHLSSQGPTGCRSVSRCGSCRDIVEVLRGPTERMSVLLGDTIARRGV